MAVRVESFSGLAAVADSLHAGLEPMTNKTGKPMFELHTWQELTPFYNVVRMIDVMTLGVKILLIAVAQISQKEPFDILYLTTWLTAMVNLQDRSFNLQPGLTWTPITNLELNFRAGIPIGPAKTEFGEKADSFRPEVWLRYYF